MNRILALAILIVGIVLMFFGFGAADSFSSEVSEALEGAPSDKSIILIVLGIIAAVVGGVSLLRLRA